MFYRYPVQKPFDAVGMIVVIMSQYQIIDRCNTRKRHLTDYALIRSALCIRCSAVDQSSFIGCLYHGGRSVSHIDKGYLRALMHPVC
ncbi:hypothetical protein SDC9_108040 [bioreactor metagenome]|uniref:Uncharacterized protein n=1 Tax=bioreactor metagenome TaxID=1076179 RepID=A0A645BHF9_9ZZZZ